MKKYILISLIIVLFGCDVHPTKQQPLETSKTTQVSVVSTKPKVETPICEPCVPERSLSNPKTDPNCPCVWTKALALAFTIYKNNPNRDHNMRHASEKITGIVLQPGEEFSFNEVVGPRTESNGFKKAPAIYDNAIADDWGGGVCQVSSTLHNALLKSGIIPTQRKAHSRPSNYIKLGLDATVSWPEQCLNKTEKECQRNDLKFVNTYSFPIGIKINVQDEHDDDTHGWVTAGIFANEDIDIDITLRTLHTFYGDIEVRKKEVRGRTKEKLVQKGQRGQHTWTSVSSESKLLHTYYSDYKPVPEIWEIPINN